MTLVSEEIKEIVVEKEEERKKLDIREDFYCKKIIYEGKPLDEDIITSVAKMTGKYLLEKYKVEDLSSDVVAESAYNIAATIASKNEDFFAKALFYKERRSVPCGIMLGVYHPNIKIALSHVLYIEPEYRELGLEEKLIGTFKYWAERYKKTDKVFIERVEEV